MKAVVAPELYCDLFLAFVYKNITESLIKIFVHSLWRGWE